MLIDPLSGAIQPARCPCCGEANNWHHMGPTVQYHFPPHAMTATPAAANPNVSFIGFMPTSAAATTAGKECTHQHQSVILPDGTEVIPLAQLTPQQQVMIIVIRVIKTVRSIV